MVGLEGFFIRPSLTRIIHIFFISATSAISAVKNSG